MQDFKQALWLAKFEIKASKFFILVLFITVAFLSIFLISSLPSYLENSFVGYDLFFIAAFSLIAAWGKPKDISYQKLSNDLWASPGLVMLKQLPVKKDVIINSRLAVNYFYTWPLQLLILILLYTLSPSLQNALNLGSFISFSIIWLSFGIYAGALVPAADTGDRIKSATRILQIIITYLIATAVLSTVMIMSEHGIVQWTIIFAQKWPILSAVISILLALIGLNFWKKHMHRKISEVDYL